MFSYILLFCSMRVCYAWAYKRKYSYSMLMVLSELCNRMEADECSGRVSSSDDSDDYEPAPIGKTVDNDPPPIPPPRGMTFPRILRPSVPASHHAEALRHQSLYHTMRTSISVDLKFLHPKGVVQLSDFITRHSALLPCQVKLLEGFASLPVPTPTDGIINLHFIKHAKVVVMTDTSSGNKISVPLNSAARFGVLYDPSSNLDEAMKGYHFDTVKEILVRKSQPLIIRATQCFQGSTALSSVENGEILRLKGIKTFFRNKQLRAQNLQGETKYLSEKCLASFTTAPEQLSLPLSQLLELGINFPASVVVCGAEDIAEERSVLLMERIAGETYLIASYPDWLHGELRYFEIPSDMNVKVEPVQLDSGSRQEIIGATHLLFHSFSSSATPVVNEARQGLCGRLLQGREQEGVQLVRPINMDIVPFTIPTPETTTAEVDISRDKIEDGVTTEEGIYAMLDCITHDGKLEGNPGRQDVLNWHDMTSSMGSKESMTSNAHANDALCANLRSLAARVEHLSLTLSQQHAAILHELYKLQSIVRDLQQEVQTPQLNQPLLDERYEENRRIISTLDCKQVVSVLSGLDLPEYAEVFLSAHVDGHVLLQLNEQVLSTELAVESKLHRIRIMNLVAGKVPIEKLIFEE